MTDPLRRINRAKKHLNVLNREIKAFIASEPYRCSINIDSEDGSYIFNLYLAREFPNSWGFLIGEVVHGLRSVLDNIAWVLAVKRDERTIFPIYLEESPDFISRLNRLREEVRDDVKALQPYKTTSGEARRNPLWVLHRVDIIDKHRVILPMTSKIYIATGLEHPKWFWMDGFTRLNKGSVQVKRFLPPNLKKDFKPQMRARILFDISCPPIKQGDPIRLTIQDLFVIHHFVRNDVYPRFAKLLEPEDSFS
jgi:hypothetical protein